MWLEQNEEGEGQKGTGSDRSQIMWGPKGHLKDFGISSK